MLTARLAALMLAAALAAGCQQSGPQADGEKVYRHAIDGAPGSLDPAHASNIYAATLVKNLFDTLYRYKYLERPYELTPNLAQGFPEVSGDGRVYLIRLREDARFADDPAFEGGTGRRVTAEDVVYSLKRHFIAETRSRGAWLWRDRIVGLEEGADITSADEAVAGLRAIDESTLRIELHEPYPQFTHTLATALSAIVPREAVEHYGDGFGVRPVGSGPFVLKQFDETRAVLEPNPHFDRGTVDLNAEGYDAERHARFGLESIDGEPYPLLDRLEIHFITEPTARWSSFESSRGVDVVMVPPEMAGRVLEDRQPLSLKTSIRERYHSLTGLEAGFVFHGFDMSNPAIGYNDDPKRQRRNRALRCAMRDAFDWTARNRAFYHGLGQVFPGVIPPLLAAYDPDGDEASIAYQPERAGERLQAAGWQPGSLPRLTYGLEASVQQRQMFEQFRAWMQAIGFPAGHIEPRTFASFGEYSRAMGQRELDIFLMGWTLAYPDAQYALQLFYGPNAAPGANSSNYANPDFDRLFERASSMSPGPERRSLYRRLNRMVIDDCVIIGSLARMRLHLWKKHVKMLPDREMVGGFFLRFVDVTGKRR
ncbi:MAG: ABC transporter substrate-binding protein [Xanthomonadales bacterium]|nr:ABC transporter substrate-binding protein [Xanthomonadales bacterium]